MRYVVNNTTLKIVFSCSLFPPVSCVLVLVSIVPGGTRMVLSVDFILQFFFGAGYCLFSRLSLEKLPNMLRL